MTFKDLGGAYFEIAQPCALLILLTSHWHQLLRCLGAGLIKEVHFRAEGAKGCCRR